MTAIEKIEKSKNERDAMLTRDLGAGTMALMTLANCIKPGHRPTEIEAPELKDFLYEKALEILGEPDKDGWGGYASYNISYSESVNPDALLENDDPEGWLEKETSYIWAVGVVVCIDWNKCDFARVFIGHLRGKDEYDRPEFIGELYWKEGENDDIGRCLDRYLECMRNCEPVFDNED